MRGGFAVPDRPGLGVKPDLERFARYEADGISEAYLDPEKPGRFPMKPAY